MHRIRTALLQLAADDPTLRGAVLPLTRQADKWEGLPKGWDASSRKKFWETLTGDNKHKVTKCIKEMSKPGKDIDDPGAFCASLADRVLGKEWRSKKATQEQMPNMVDGAVARFKDQIEVTINEHYRMAFPAQVPPTLTLVHGNDFIRVIKADGGLTREAVAFIARSTGNVYLAATWDRPKPFVVANVLQTETWRHMRLGFDQFNVPELLGQLKKVLLDKGLDDTWKEIQQCKVPQKVNDAWMSLSKKDRKKKAARLASLRTTRLASLRYARSLSDVLAGMFQPARDWVKDYGGFIKVLGIQLRYWDSNVSAQVRKDTKKVTPKYQGWVHHYSPTKYTTWQWSDVTVESWQEVKVEIEVTGGPSHNRYGDPYDAPEPIWVEVPEVVVLKGQAVVNIPLLARSLTTAVKAQIKPGFEDRVRSFLLEVFGGRGGVVLWNMMADEHRKMDPDDIIGGMPGSAVADEVISNEYGVSDSAVSYAFREVDVVPSRKPTVKWKLKGDKVIFDIEARGTVTGAEGQTVYIEYDGGY